MDENAFFGFSRSRFVDRDCERQTFTTLVESQADAEARMIAVKDASGWGKTFLLRWFEEYCRDKNIPVSLIDFHENPQISEPYHLVQALWDSLNLFNLDFPKYVERQIALSSNNFSHFAQLSGVSSSAGIPQAGMIGGANFSNANLSHATGNTIGGSVLQVSGPVSGGLTVNMSGNGAIDGRLDQFQQKLAYGKIMTGFIEDLDAIARKRLVVIMFDAFQEVKTEVSIWIHNQLLESLCLNAEGRPPNLICILAGTELPSFPQHKHRVVSINRLGDWDPVIVRQYLELHGCRNLTDGEVEVFWGLLKNRRIDPQGAVGMARYIKF